MKQLADTGTRLAGVDEWQAERVSQIGLEADRRRDEHRSECAEAVQHNGSQASAGGPDWTPQVLQLRWPTG